MKDEKITGFPRITHRTCGGTGNTTISDCPSPLTDALESALIGVRWLTTDGKGVVTTAEKFEDLPDPIREPLWGESWQQSKSCDGVVARYETPEIGKPPEGWCSPSIMVSHLVGYGLTKEAYLREARKFQSWGFCCMRSRRGNDGKYWEVWYLPGYWATAGDLREHYDKIRGWEERSVKKPA